MTVELCTNKISAVFIPTLPIPPELECKRCESGINIGTFLGSFTVAVAALKKPTNIEMVSFLTSQMGDVPLPSTFRSD